MTADRYFPLRAAGFWANPFRALSDREWAEVAVLSPCVRECWDRSSADLQILGSMGAGKTTTLLALKALAEDEGQRVAYAYLAEGRSDLPGDLPDVATLDLMLVDEAQRLSRRGWACVLGPLTGRPAGAPRLVLASHRDQAPRLATAGRPCVTVDVDRMTPAEYRAVLDRRLAQARLADRPHATLSDDAVAYLLAAFGTERRAAERLLYEVFQRLRAPEVVDVDRLRAVREGSSSSGGAA
jgi:hypothetical protein